MRRLMKNGSLLMSALFLAACANNPTAPNAATASLDGKSVWFADDNSMKLEVVGSKSIVTRLSEDSHDSIVYSNILANDGSLEVLDDGNVLFSTIGAFSHEEQELDFAFGKQVFEFIKAPSVKSSDFTGVWLDIYQSDEYVEELAVYDTKENSYDMYSYFIDHELKEYEYFEDKDYPFEFVDGYKLIEEDYIYYIKRFEAEKEIEYVDMDGYSWVSYWYPKKTQLVPADYKQVDEIDY